MKKLNHDFVCDVCENLIILLVTREESEKAETQSINCCGQTLKIDTNRSSNDNNDDDNVAIVLVSEKFTIKKKELTEYHRALKLKGAINMEPMDSTDMKLKRKHVEIQSTDAEDNEPLSFASPIKSNDHERYSDKSNDKVSDDYTKKYNRNETYDYKIGDEEYDPDNDHICKRFSGLSNL
ncbi:unnamed protein product [Lactuca virosa]|uniref:Uncharacterized protein n=1 Tax=Lactuca virosa TaxID=75947 RepID=A0AAU9NUP5_9ASTR|nr:unnamed protein product [Lactuca virosa]